MASLERPAASRSEDGPLAVAEVGERLTSAGAGRAAANSVATRAASEAPKTMPPAAAARIAPCTSSAPDPLSRYPDAPARIALSTVSSSSFMVSITTRVRGGGR